jgi:hypothetical protein
MAKRKDGGANLFTLRCETCNRYLVLTESGYWACPNGHGKLVIDTYDVSEADTFLMFPDDLEETNGVP